VTALITFFAVLLLVPGGVAAAAVARQRLTDMEWEHAHAQAVITAADIRAGRLTNPITPRVTGADLIQVVAPDHRVVASSTAAKALPLMTDAWPTRQEPRLDVQTCGLPHVGCVRWEAVLAPSPPVKTPANSSPNGFPGTADTASTAQGPYVVYVGERVSSPISTGIFDTLFAIQVAGLIFLTAWATWKVTGRTLRPVGVIRAELAAINVNDLSSRVPEPVGEDEIARLARTINNTLGRLDHAQRGLEQMLEQQRQFASDASHELRTPIAGLRTQLEDAVLHFDATDLHAMLGHALGDVDRLEAIAADLLLLARLGADVPENRVKLDLAELVEGEVSTRAGRHPTHLRLEAGTMVGVVPGQMRRALSNLLDNAQRHAKGAVSVDVRRAGDGAELIVSDDGEGIPIADRERVFLRFTRLDTARSRAHGGTGLGLAIAQEIARAHHGTLSIEDSPGGGARFILRVPLDGSSPARS
jgi:signal transduction histidine kinase